MLVCCMTIIDTLYLYSMLNLSTLYCSRLYHAVCIIIGYLIICYITLYLWRCLLYDNIFFVCLCVRMYRNTILSSLTTEFARRMFQGTLKFDIIALIVIAFDTEYDFNGFVNLNVDSLFLPTVVS